MADYKLYSRTLKDCIPVSELRLSPEAAKEHHDYPTEEWYKHPSFRLHVRIKHTADQTYCLSFIDEHHKKATTQVVTTEVMKAIVVSRGEDNMIHFDPDHPFKACRLGEFCKELFEVIKVKDIPVWDDLVLDVMEYLRNLCRKGEVDDHVFVVVEVRTEDVYMCSEGVGDTGMVDELVNFL